MASKLEYLQRYMDKGSETTAKKLKKKRKKEKPSTSSSLRIVDGDHDWAQEAPQRARTGAGPEEDAMADDDDVMANGAIDPEDMPTIANADQYEEELQREWDSALKKNTDEGIVEKDGNVDLSPPRRRRGDRGSDDASPPRRGRTDAGGKRGNADGGDDDGDASPPRRRQRNKSDDGPALRRTSAQDDSDGDVSPPRRRSSRKEDTNDMSPPRRRPETKSRDRSSERRPPSSPKHGTERGDRSRGGRRAASSPPRRGSDRRSRSRSRAQSSRTERRRSPSRSMDRSRHRNRRSPSPRKDSCRSSHRDRGRPFSPDDRKRGKDDNRRSRRSRHHSRSNSRSGRSRSKSASPPRRPSARLSSSKRKDMHDDEDASPPRKSQRKSSDDLPVAADKLSVQETSAASVLAPAPAAEDEYKPRAGLFTATEFAEDLKKKVAHNDILRGATAEDMGHNAETVYRDKKGRKLDMLSEMVKQQEIMDGKLKREAQDHYEWGTGRVQKEEKLSQKELLDKMKSKPFARRDDDEELDKMRRERVRAFDPMNSKVFQDDTLFHDGPTSKKKTKKKSKKSKSSKRAAPSVKPKYAGPPAPPNRFGVQPGYRWDGVVRGTAWEEKLMLRDNALNANSDEAYRYAVADM